MEWLIFICVFAAFGLLGVLWCCFGVLLPKTGGILLLPAGPGIEILARRYLWLRGMGLLHCILLVVGDVPGPERKWLVDRGIEICSREDISSRLGIGEKDFDGTGTGDPAGRDQRGGISEL